MRNLQGEMFSMNSYRFVISYCRKQGATPTLKNLLLGRRVMGEMLVERIPLDSIPEDPIQATEWLHESYRQKVSSFPWFMERRSQPGLVVLSTVFSKEMQGLASFDTN